MDIGHNFHKFKIYFQPGKDYWCLSDSSKCVIKNKTGPFFLNLKDRLEDGHYDKFDDQGFPVRQYKGRTLYNYTTICSYSLAKWQLYLETGKVKYTQQLLKTVDFLKKNHQVTEYGGIVFPFKEKLSAMNQGEALSVVARAYEYSRDNSLVKFARDILKAYEVPVRNYGVLGQFKSLDDVYWFEERAELPHKHILNGMIYSMVGLKEISTIMPELESAQKLWLDGINYLKKALPLFDNGYWSWYWNDEEKPNYIASAMYHNLHICQLKYLYDVSGINEFNLFANRFEYYYSKRLYRIRAGISLAIDKWHLR